MATIKAKKNNEWQSVAIGKTEIIEVPAEPVIEEIEITENGTYSVPDGVDGYNPVIVNIVSGGGGGEDIEPIVLTGDCEYSCRGEITAKYIELFGNTITTENITNAK